MKLKTALITGAASAALLASSGAVAGDHYIGVFGGFATFGDDFIASASGSTTSTVYHSVAFPHTHFFTAIYGATFEEDFESGWVVGASIGTSIAPQVRGELEVAYRTFDINEGAKADAGLYLNSSKVKYSSAKYSNQETVLADFDVSSAGDINIWSFMTNLWYDFDMGNNSSAIQPFVGGGFGLARMSMNYSASMAGTFTATSVLPWSASGSTIPVTMATNNNNDDWVFAYQFGGGAAYVLGNGSSISAQYRYFGTTDAQLGLSEVSGESHNLMIGFNFPIN